MNNFIGKPTIFCDIDATVVEQPDGPEGFDLNAKALPGAVAKINKWYDEGCCIVFTTARHSSFFYQTHKQLTQLGFKFQLLMMEIGSGKRWVINNEKTHTKDTAGAIVVGKNMGLENIELE